MTVTGHNNKKKQTEEKSTSPGWPTIKTRPQPITARPNNNKEQFSACGR
jgi:hypothetical protein